MEDTHSKIVPSIEQDAASGTPLGSSKAKVRRNLSSTILIKHYRPLTVTDFRCAGKTKIHFCRNIDKTLQLAQPSMVSGCDWDFSAWEGSAKILRVGIRQNPFKSTAGRGNRHTICGL